MSRPRSELIPRLKRLGAVALDNPLLTAAALLVACLALLPFSGAGPRPVWARAWRLTLPSARWAAAGPAFGRDDLAGLRLPRPAARNHADTGADRAALAPPGDPGLIAGIFAEVRETEDLQRRAALGDWSGYLRALTARRLSEARLWWEERLRDLAIEFGQANDSLLAAFAAQARQESLPMVSALQIEITLCDDPEYRPVLEEKLRRVFSDIEDRIAMRREELSRQCAAELENLREQASKALDDLAAQLLEMERRSLDEFRAVQESAYAEWSRTLAEAEASALAAWGELADDER